MKKLKIKNFNLQGADMLTRSQLKLVMGGDGEFTTVLSSGCRLKCVKADWPWMPEQIVWVDTYECPTTITQNICPPGLAYMNECLC